MILPDGVRVIRPMVPASTTRRASSLPASPIFDRSIPYPGRIFYAGAWRTPKQIEKRREAKRKRPNRMVEPKTDTQAHINDASFVQRSPVERRKNVCSNQRSPARAG